MTPDKLLLEIARCPLVELVATDHRPTHPCHPVVTHQWPVTTDAKLRGERWLDEHHIPTPWIGHLELAPLLFLSSNPSLASHRKEHAPAPADFARPIQRIGIHTATEHSAFRHGLASPKPAWTDSEIVDRFSNTFDVWMVDGRAGVKDETGDPGDEVVFWSKTRDLADAFFGGDALPGWDYALTEVVHCGSVKEIGVDSAALACGALYLRRVIAASPARYIVVLGDKARNTVRRVFAYDAPGRISKPLRVGRRDRRFVFLAHPSASRIRDDYPRRLPEEELAPIRALLKNGKRPRPTPALPAGAKSR